MPGLGLLMSHVGLCVQKKINCHLARFYKRSTDRGGKTLVDEWSIEGSINPDIVWTGVLCFNQQTATRSHPSEWITKCIHDLDRRTDTEARDVFIDLCSQRL